jgi:two-component system sensor histidine kinase KdpD
VWVLALLTLVLVTAGLRAVRGELQQAHVVLVYLLLVLTGSAFGGRVLGLVLSVLGFVAIDYFFQVPYDHLSVESRLDWFVLGAFVVTAGIAASLFARAQAATDRAHARSDEVRRLSQLGAELLGAGTAEHALSAIADKVRESLRATTVVMFRVARAGPPATLDALVRCGTGPPVATSDALRAADDGALVTAGESLFLPLRVHDRIVGVLGIGGPMQRWDDDGSRRFLDALSYYAALAVERVRLVAEAEHAEALRESDRMREALLASVSHDLRTPLTTIRVLAQDALGRRDLETALANAAVIEEQAERLSRIVSNLLDLTRLRGKAFPVHPEGNAAEDLVGAVARQVAGILGEHPLVPSIEQGGAMLVGQFDFVQTQRILTNLIENAVRYASPRAPIAFDVRREDDALVFSVSDDGPGVPREQRDEIFEAFHQTPSASADVGGVGLGLYIGRALAEAQGGSLSYAERAGGGSSFVLRLPSAPETLASADAAQSDGTE